MACNSGPDVVEDKLVLALDANNTRSYPGSGSTWFDLSGNGYDFTFVSTAFNTDGDGIKNMNFSGSHGIAKRTPGGTLTDVPPYNNATIMCFTKIADITSTWRTFVRGASYNHPVIMQTNGNIGFYSNVGSGFYSAGISGEGSTAYDVDASLPNYDSKYNCLTWKLSNSSPYWQLQYNDSDVVATITDSDAAYVTHGFASIGGYHNGNATNSDAQATQYWGNVAVFLYYSKHLSQSEILQNYNALRGRFEV